MYFLKYLILTIFILFIVQSCNQSANLTKDQIELIKITSELFLDQNTVLYHKTYDKDLLERVVGDPISNEILNYNIYIVKINMDSLFDE